MPRLKGVYADAFVIGCIDPQSAPDIVFEAELGQIIYHSELAALVPPYDTDRSFGPYSLLTKLEFAIDIKRIEHVVLIGHSHCTGIDMLVNGTDHAALSAWVEVARTAMKRARQIVGNKCQEALIRETERQATIQSLRNLMTYPVVYQAVKEGRLSLDGWFFSAHEGALYAYDPQDMDFKVLYAFQPHGCSHDQVREHPPHQDLAYFIADNL